MTARTSRIHQSDCEVWDLPSSGTSDPLRPETGRDPAIDRYLTRIAPAYATLGRVMAQLAGVFLLELTRDGAGQGLSLDHPIHTLARDQLAEARDVVAGVPLPPAARRHHAALLDLADHLAKVATGLARMAARRGTATYPTDRRDVLHRLAAAQRLLISTAEPDAGITPVNFDNACCTCTTPRKPG